MRYLLVLGVVVLGVTLVATATAGKPLLARDDIDETFADEFLTDACGFEVMTHAEGHIITKEFDREKGTLEVRTLNIALTAMANGNTYRFRDVGADHTKVTRDGPVLSIVGQIPFDFFGVLKINLDTGEVTHEPNTGAGTKQLARACAALEA